MKQNELTKYLKNEYPEELAASFDVGKIGLQFGSSNKEIKKVLIALDGTKEVIEQAIDEKCDLIITHHPFMFMPMISLNYDSPFGQKLIKVLENRINIYSMHTNFDTAHEGMNDILSNVIGIQNIQMIKDEIDQTCLMRFGDIKPIKLIDLMENVSNKIGQSGIKYVGNPNKIIHKVGIVGGAGSSEIKNALHSGCDCFITGEIQHHLALEAKEIGICLIEVNHFVESFFKIPLKQKLAKRFPNIEFKLANEEDPFNCYIKK